MSLEDQIQAIAPIPPHLLTHLLPVDKALTLFHLINFPIPPCEQVATLIPGHQISFSTLSSSRFRNKATADIRLLQHLPLLPPTTFNTVIQHAITASQASPISSFTYPIIHKLADQLGPFDALPLWVLSYWARVYSVASSKYDWAAFLANVGSLGGNAGTLQRLPWDLPLPQLGPLNMVAHVADLIAFSNQSWLAGRHIDLMLYTLAFECHDAGLAFIDTTAFDTLWKVFHQTPDTYPRGVHPSIPDIGSRLHELRKVVLVVSVRVSGGKYAVSGLEGVVGNHWISVVIDREEEEIRHYDAMGGEPPESLRAMLNWWLAVHGALLYTQEYKPCTQQRDTWSCGVLCVNALAHDVQPAKYPLLDASECDRARVWLLEGILCYLHQFDERFPSVPFRIALKAPPPPPPASAPPVQALAESAAAAKAAACTIPARTKSKAKARLKGSAAASAKSSTSKPKTGSKTGSKAKPAPAAPTPKLKITMKRVTVPGTTSSAAAKRKWQETFGDASTIATPPSPPPLQPPPPLPPAPTGDTDLPTTTEPQGTTDAREPTAPPLEPSADDLATPVFEDAEDDPDDWQDIVEEICGEPPSPSDEPGYSRSDLIDIPVVKSAKNKGGRPPDPVLNALIRKCYLSTDEARKPIYRCAGDPENGIWCGFTYASNSKKRWFKHGMRCTKVTPALRQKIAREAAKWAPSAKAEAAKAKAEASLEAISNAPVNKASKSSPEQTAASVSKLHDAARSAGRIARHAALDEAILLFFCIAGISLHIIELEVFRRILRLADRSYKPASREKLEYEHIQGEAAAILQRQVELLKKKEFLTISYDGGTANNSRREAFFTFNVTTEDGETYLMEVRAATDVSHTAEWIKDVALEVIDQVGRDKFAGSVCDSTGNTSGSRPLLVLDIPTLIALADVCHHLSNTSKDIAKLPYFEDVIKGVRAVISKFHRAHKGIHLIERERRKQGIPRGLESIGKTRFLTVYRGAMSVERCTEPIRYIVMNEELEGCEEFENYFQGRHSAATFHFHKILNDFTSIGSPFLRALTCLEAVGANAADVYVLWHAILREVDAVVHDKQRGIPVETRDLIIGILNRRHRQLFEDGGKLASPIYLTCAYLHPELLKNGLFKDEDRTKYFGENWTAIRFPCLFERVYKFILKVAVNEIKHGSRPQFTRWKGRAGEFKGSLVSELRMYSRMQYPYNTPPPKTRDIKTWWKSIEGLPNADILPGIALKLFSIRVNSMPEERTVSAFTWMTPPVRNRLHLSTLTAMTTIRQYHQTQTFKEARVFGAFAFPLFTIFLQKRGASSSRPLLYFQDIPKSSQQPSSDDEDEDEDAVDHTEPSDDEDDDDITPSAALDISCSGADMNSRYITQALADSDDAHAMAATGAAEGPHEPDARKVPIDDPLLSDNDFDFDPTDLSQ